MKKLAVVCVLACVAAPVRAGNINLGGATPVLNQSEFRDFSQDLGSALSYKAVTPPAPLGVTGFDLGLEVTGTQMKQSSLWQKATGSSVNTLPIPKLHAYKGLPLGFDIGAVY